VKVSFNHRYHPALQQAKALFAEGALARSSMFGADTGTGPPRLREGVAGEPSIAGGGELWIKGASD
jgi:predicted dehydrogenase